MTSARNFLIRGLFAGLVAGLVAFGVAYAIGEPSINAAIAIEDAAGSGHEHADEPESTIDTDDTPIDAPTQAFDAATQAISTRPPQGRHRPH